MKQKYYIIKEGYGHRVGDAMEEHPDCKGFFRAFESGSEYVFMSPDEVALDKFNVLNYTTLKTNMILPTDAQERKGIPITTGVLDYFPLAIAEVAKCSWAGNQQHHPGEALHWDREKSTDHADCAGRHLVDRGKFDSDGKRHSAKLAWRALALLQIELEEDLKKGKNNERE